MISNMFEIHTLFLTSDLSWGYTFIISIIYTQADKFWGFGYPKRGKLDYLTEREEEDLKIKRVLFLPKESLSW